MKFGVREICDVVFKTLQTVKIGGKEFPKGAPVLYIDSAKTSTIEGAATTVYAQGGKGNARLLAWEGEKTLTFTVEDALLSPIGFAILSGAGLFKPDKEAMNVHCTSIEYANNGKFSLTGLGNDTLSETAPMFVMAYEDGSIGEFLTVSKSGTGADYTITTENKTTYTGSVFVDYYIEKDKGVSEMVIDAANFAGFYYVEASTLFRRESDGKDLPAEIIFPRVKIQSNFTFSMASTGDPSTFTFTMDAFPGNTFFENKKKVLCAMQVVEDSVEGEDIDPVTEGDFVTAGINGSVSKS
jgi:hypothetical protein